MTEKEIQQFSKAAKAFGDKVTASKEASLAFLISVGVLPKGTTLQDISGKKS
jgi:hypothetical protein